MNHSHTLPEKFKIFEYNASGSEVANKLLDERAFYTMYPTAIDYEELAPSMRKLASTGQPSIISGDSLMSVFEERAKIVKTRKKYIRYTLYFDANDLRSTIMSVPHVDGGCLGVNGSIFELGFDSDVYGPNDIVVIEGLEQIPLIFKSHPRAAGIKYMYEVATLDRDTYIKEEWLRVGLQVKADAGSTIGEATVERGNVHWTSGKSFVEFEVPMSRLGWEMKVTDEMWRNSKNYAIRPCDKMYIDKIGSADIIFNEFDATFKKQTDIRIDAHLAYSRSSGRFSGLHLDGITEKAMSTTAGFWQYMESATRMEYNIHSNILDYLSNYLSPMFPMDTKLSGEVLDVFTGKAGLKLVQEAGKEWDARSPVIQTPELNYSKEQAFGKGRNAVALNAKQYRAFHIDPIGLVRFHHLPMLDVGSNSTKKIGMFPSGSYDFIIFNDGRGDGREDNIYILQNDEMEQFGYSTGTWTPTGPALKNGNYGKYHNGLGTENAYKIIREVEVGMVIKDPGYITWIRPAVR